MIVAITGATGFIGKLLVKKHILLGDEVRVLSRKESLDLDDLDQIRVFKGDLLSKESLENFVCNVDVLYHCAAEIKDESLMNFVNVDGTKNLIEVAAGNVNHWVQLSSTGVYGPIYSGVVTEDQPYNPINEYERTKLKSDFLVMDAGSKNRFTYTLIRPSNVFGYQMTNQSLFQLVNMIDKGLYFFVGSKGASANYVPVDNVIEVLYLAATNPRAKGNVYIVSEWCTIEKFVEVIVETLKKPFPIVRFPVFLAKAFAYLTIFVPRNPLTLSRIKALSTRVSYDTAKVKMELGYSPVVSIKDSVVKLVKFYKKDFPL